MYTTAKFGNKAEHRFFVVGLSKSFWSFSLFFYRKNWRNWKKYKDSIFFMKNLKWLLTSVDDGLVCRERREMKIYNRKNQLPNIKSHFYVSYKYKKFEFIRHRKKKISEDSLILCEKKNLHAFHWQHEKLFLIFFIVMKSTSLKNYGPH